MSVHEAACSCGALRLRCEGEPTLVSMCNCFDCQRRTGSVFGVQAWFPAEQVKASGEARSFTRQGASGGDVTFSFCPACGSTMSALTARRPGEFGVPVGAFADPTFPAPSVSVWERRRHGWAGAIAELPMTRFD